MFGKRSGGGNEAPTRERVANPHVSAAPPPPPPPPSIGAKSAATLRAEASRVQPVTVDSRSEQYYEVKTTIFNALIDTIDLAQLVVLRRRSAMPISTLQIWMLAILRQLVAH